MNKETEELLIYGIGAYLLLTLLSRGPATSVLSQQKIAAGTNAIYANDAASVINTAINDFTG